nr:eukaryotic translation initiation factor 2 [Gleditsia microphylla]
MPFPMKIQPIDSHIHAEGTRPELAKPVVKSRLKRLFERQFPGVLKSSAAERVGGEELHFTKDLLNDSNDFEPSSVCLAKMVQNFMEENQEKQSAFVRCGRTRCNCFNGNGDDSSGDESDAFGNFGDSNYSSTGEASEILKGLVACASVCEKNLLADTSKIVEKNKICRRKDDFCRKLVTDGLLAIGYDASICKSRWEKSPFYPAGEYEYIDVIIEGERVLVDIDFRSEFEIARSTKTYKTILQTLPHIFVGKSDRLQSIIAIVSEAAKQSLRKKGMHIPPWRKAEYVKAKWFSPYTRTTPTKLGSHEMEEKTEKPQPLTGGGEFELSHGEGKSSDEELNGSVFTFCDGSEEDEKAAAGIGWKPPVPKPKSFQSGVKIVTGLTAVFDNL